MPKFFPKITSPIHVISAAKKITSPVHIQCERGVVQLATNRLIFRSFNYFDEDLLRENYSALLGSPENLTHYGTGKVWTSEEIDAFLKQERQNRDAGHLYGAFSVHEKESGHFIGSLGVEFKDQEYVQVGAGHENVAEINYILMRSAWGRGYGKELATVGKKLASFILESEKDHPPSEVVATVHPENIASATILEKVLKCKEEEEFKKYSGNPRILYFKPLKKGKTVFLENDDCLMEKKCLLSRVN